MDDQNTDSTEETESVSRTDLQEPEADSGHEDGELYDETLTPDPTVMTGAIHHPIRII